MGWIYAKRPVFGFVLLFVVLMAVFYAITFIPVVNQDIFPAYMRFNAKLSVVVINVFGEGATASGTAVTSSRFSVDIRHGCDAVAPSALFIAAVLAFPGTLRSKVPGILVGTLVLAAINIIRIVSLFYTGIYFPRAFEAMHVDVWQPVFILLALTFWVVWAWWATRPKTAKKHVAMEKD
jgi:exosortase H (IPTLxxWG-CTERM-specific)